MDEPGSRLRAAFVIPYSVIRTTPGAGKYPGSGQRPSDCRDSPRLGSPWRRYAHEYVLDIDREIPAYAGMTI